MRLLLGSASLAAIAAVSATGEAQAQRQITTAITTPVTTGTAADNGGPADITITSAGSIRPTASGPAVTVNSDNDVTNQGTIGFNNVNNADGILVTAGGTGTITNSGAISLVEDYTPTDTDSDGDLDGAFAQGQNRFGIRTTGAFVGSIVNSGSITIEGNDSGAIRLGGPMTGSLNSSGTITVLGDRSIGIRTEDVSGNVTVRGAVSAQGRDAVAVAIDGDVGGALVFQGTVNATGFRTINRPSVVTNLDADDLLIGGPAIRITGNVAGGVLFDIPPVESNANSTDDDNDGIADAQEGTATIASYGSAPALAVGSADNIVIGAVAGDAEGHGIVVRGSILGAGIYDNVDAVAIRIGGQGGTVDLTGGLRLAGSVSATGARDATAVQLAQGALVDRVTISNQLGVQVSGTGTARAIQIQQGAVVPVLTNSGAIGVAAGDKGTAIAIEDQSGTLALVTNTGRIAVGSVAGTLTTGTAIDLAANTSGATIRQQASAANASPSIVGAIRLGSGADLVDLQAGTIVGDINFGGGADRLVIANTATLVGGLSNAGGLSADVAGRLELGSGSPASIGSLALASTGVLGITIDESSTNASRLNVAGNASFAQGATLAVALRSVSTAQGSYAILDAGSLTGGQNLTLGESGLPFLFDGTLVVDDAAGAIRLDIDRKTAGELGFNRSLSSAYDAVFAVIDEDDDIRDIFLAAPDAETVRARFGSFLPEHTGGVFQNVTLATRTAARSLETVPSEAIATRGTGLFFNTLVWGTSKDEGETQAYRVNGWGVQGGGELSLGDAGRIGASLALYLGLNETRGNFNSVETSQYEAAVHWRRKAGGLTTFARGAYSLINFQSQRRFDVVSESVNFSRVASADYGGGLISGIAGATYEAELSDRFRVRPRIVVDYFRLTENGFTETGGGNAFNLIVDKRVSDEAAVEGTVTIGYELGSLDNAGTPLRAEMEGGYRKIVGGSVDNTTARFTNGQPFTLEPQRRVDGWVGRGRMLGGSEGFQFGAEGSAEDQAGALNLGLRLGVQIGW
jgi:hypothetical protein